MPNPVANISTINITSPEECNGKIQLFGITGTLISTIYNGHFVQGVQSFNISKNTVNSAGLYIVKTTLSNGTTLHKKVIIK